jgi:excisionase family DNA binding protein
METKLLLRPGEAAQALGVSRSKMYDLLQRRVIPSVRLDGVVRVPSVQLHAWIAEQVRTQAETAR